MLRHSLKGLKRAAAAHLKLLRTSRAYAAALAAAAARMAVQTSWERFLAALITGLVAIYTAVRRATGWTDIPEIDDGMEPA